MGLFSKLFSKENEAVEKAQDEREPAVVFDTKKQAAPSAASVAEPVAPGASDKPIEAPPAERAAVMQDSASLAKQDAAPRETPVAEAAPPPAPPEPAAPPKRDDARPAPPPAAGRATATPARAPAAAAPPPAAKAASKQARAAEPAKTAAGQVPRAQPAAARKTTQHASAATEEAIAPKRTRKPTPRVFGAPAVPSVPERADALPLAADVDAAVDTLLDESASLQNRSAASDEAADQRAAAETFSEVAKLHAHPVREFMFQLSVGRTPRQWAAACRPLLPPLLEASKQIGLAELTLALAAFDAALERACSESSACIGEAAGAALEQAYARLHAQLPAAFAKITQADNRRLILLESLLLQVPALHRRTLGKLYAAGLTSLPLLSQAKADELAAVAGIDRELAQAVVEHIARFERERSRVDPTAMRSHVCDRLRALVGRLGQLQAEFERAEQDESKDRKRAARRGREQAVHELELLLSEVGDLELLEELKRCPVRSKITRVESYLQRLQASA